MASAVPLFNGLKHLPCPRETAGSECSTSGCLFGHRADGQSSNVRPVRSFDGAAEQDDLAAGECQSPPKKRQKTTSTAPAPELAESDGQRPPTSGVSSKPVDKAKASELYDPLSPPSVSDVLRGAEPPGVVTPSFSNEIPTPPPRAAASRLLSKPATPRTLSPSAASTSVSTSSSPSPIPASVRKTTAESPLGKLSSSTSSSLFPLASSSQIKSIKAPLAAGQSAAKDEVTSSDNPKAPRKPESLNPRLLKSAPAAHGSRHQLLTLMYTELARLNTEVSKQSMKNPELKTLVMPDQELIWMALDREQKIAIERAPIYPNLMRQEVMKYKKMKVDAWIAERTQALEKKSVQTTSDVGPPIIINTGLTEDQEIQVLNRIITPISNLAQYGYVPKPPTDEEIRKAREAVDMSKGWEQCDRCEGRFQVFPGRNITTGELASGGECTHHPGRLYFPEPPRGDVFIVKKYRCCNEDAAESKGCAKTQHHVFKISDPKRLASLWNFAQTPANDSPHVKKAVAFDCEMGYSVHGMELVRLTATSWPDGAELVDVLVQPFGEIIDLNSKYSGVFPEDLARAVPWRENWTPPPQRPGERKILQKVSSPQAARDLLFSFINPDTVLIGHGLENDLNVTRIIHPKIVDTILLYPHKRGLPIRTSLKALMLFCLNRRIQVDTGEGHDSAEDARAAGDLVRLKVQKEWTLMQTNGWKVVDAVIQRPGWKPPAPPLSSEDSVDKKDGGAPLIQELLNTGS